MPDAWWVPLFIICASISWIQAVTKSFTFWQLAHLRVSQSYFFLKSVFLKHSSDPAHLNSLILIREIVESRPCFHYTKMIASFYEIVSSLQEMKYSAIIIFLNILGTVCFTESGCVWNFGIGLFCQKRELSSKLKMCSTNCRLGWTLETVKIYFETKNTIINGGSTSVTLSTWFALFNLIKPLYTD